MKLTSERAKELQEKLAAQKNPAEAAKIAKEYGIDLSAEDVEKILDQVSSGMQALSDNEIEKVSGGDLAPFMEEEIRAAYIRGGPSLAVIQCIYYVPSEICYQIVHAIELQMGYNP